MKKLQEKPHDNAEVFAGESEGLCVSRQRRLNRRADNERNNTGQLSIDGVFNQCVVMNRAEPLYRQLSLQ